MRESILATLTPDMQLYKIQDGLLESVPLPGPFKPLLPGSGFYWLAVAQASLPAGLPELQQLAQQLGGAPLLDLHVTDLQSMQHPSNYDYTSVYDLVIFRRLQWVGKVGTEPVAAANIFQQIATQAVSFVVYDQLLISVHPDGCEVARGMLSRFQDNETTLVNSVSGVRGLPSPNRFRFPSNSADLMLRMIDAMVDAYLAIRKDLTAGLEVWLSELLKPNPKVRDWTGLMAARNELQALEDICDEQHEALREWLASYAQPNAPGTGTEAHDTVVARARDLIEHIQRVVQHVRRLEASAETSVQIYFGAQSHRANNIMKTLTALTAVFLPLNLITGFFGMNFEFLPLIHQPSGLWWAMGFMTLVAIVLVVVFWRKRYLARSTR
jgi:magnesium transporter